MHKVLALVFLMVTATTWAQSENSWTKKASFGGLKREKAVAFSIGDYGYVGCGVDTAETTHNDLWQYDPGTDSWTQLASIPGSERRNAIAFVAEGKGYVGTGFTLDDGDLGEKLKDLWEYDPGLNSWEAKADYPGGGDTGIYQATAFSVLNKGYVACGKIGSDAYIPEMWEYNPATDVWTERTPFPGGDRYQLISFVLEGKAYVGLGTDHDVFRKDMWEYDPVSNTWQGAPDFPGTERAQASTFTLGIKGFVVFGSDGGHKDELWEYNYYSESWISRAPFPPGGRRHAVAFAIADTGYAGLGKSETGKKQSFYAYAPTGPLSLNEIESIDFNFYPNPVQSVAKIVLPAKLNKGKTLLFDQQGRKVKTISFSSSEFDFNRNGIQGGMYYLIILDANDIPVGYKKITLL